MTTTIRISDDEVQSFAARWPCSGLDEAPGLYVQFDHNGDLIDLVWDQEPSEYDGYALSCLIDDVKVACNV